MVRVLSQMLKTMSRGYFVVVLKLKSSCVFLHWSVTKLSNPKVRSMLTIMTSLVSLTILFNALIHIFIDTTITGEDEQKVYAICVSILYFLALIGQYVAANYRPGLSMIAHETVTQHEPGCF